MENKKNNQKKFAKYFSKPIWIPILFTIGLILCIAGSEGIILGILCLGGAGYGIYNYFKNKVTDEEFDTMLKQEIENTKKIALKKVGLDSSDLVADEYVVCGPRFWNLGGADVKYKKGKDKQARYTPVDVFIMNFTKKQLSVYKCALDLLTGNHLNEQTDEFFYQDVVSVSTESKSMTEEYSKIDDKIKEVLGISPETIKDKKRQLDVNESFTLTTSGGTSISTIISSDTIKNKVGKTDLSQDEAERVIQGVRKILRDKKV